MLKLSRSSLLASAFLLLGAASGSIHADDDPIFEKAKQAFDAIGKGTDQPAPPLMIVSPSAPQLVMPAAATVAAPVAAAPVAAAPVVAAPVVAAPMAPAIPCQTGTCAAPAGSAAPRDEDKSCCSCLKKIGHWFHCEARTDCACCFRPTPYWPSVYTWFPVVPGPNCSMPGGCVPPCGVIPVGKHYDAPLPQPQMPKMASAEKPIVPGSLSALASDNDSTNTTPVNYKSMPVVPAAPLNR